MCAREREREREGGREGGRETEREGDKDAVYTYIRIYDRFQRSFRVIFHWWIIFRVKMIFIIVEEVFESLMERP